MSAFQRTGMSVMAKTNYTSGGGFGFKTVNKKGATIRKNSMNTTGSNISHDTFKEQFQGRNRKDFINEANKIMRERMKNKGSTINSKSKFKNVVLQDSKEICLKNYLIGLLKEKRTDLNEKERNIEKALKQSENQLDRDTKIFIDFIERTKNKVKNEDDELIKNRSSHDKAEIIFRKESTENKKLSEELERTVKVICLLKNYGSFVYKVMGQKFWFDGIKDVDPRIRNFEEVGNNIIKKYDSINEYEKQQIQNDESVLILKFKEFEDKVIKILDNKEIVDKEMTGLKKTYHDELQELKKRQIDIKNEAMRINKEKSELFLENEKVAPKADNETDMYIKFILELGTSLNVIDRKFFKTKKNITDYLTVAQDTLKLLAEKENIINGYINEIERIEEFEDKKLIQDIEQERKKDNKREKQLNVKLNQQQLEKQKRIKAEERGRRLVIKGRKVPKEIPFLKEKKKKQFDNKKNNDNDFDMIFYSDND